MLAAQHATIELTSLTARYGRARIVRFYNTFDAFVHAGVTVVTKKHIALPPPPPGLAHDSRLLAASLYHAGIMPDRRFDIGFLIEHLLSRPVHKTLMDQANASPAIGPAANADFHLIFTRAMTDVASLYHLK